MSWQACKGRGFLALRSGLALVSAVATQGCMFLVDFEELKQGDGAADGGLSNPPDDPEPGVDPGGAGNGGTPPSPAGGNGGGGGTPGGPNAGGSGNAQPCSGDGECDDGDACTTDSCSNGSCRTDDLVCEPSSPCVVSMCVAGACVEEPIAGLVPDGFDDVLVGDELYRTTMIAGSDRFFHAVYGVFDGVEDLRLGGFDSSGSAQLRAQSLASGLMGANFEVGSPGALVLDDSDSVNVYVAARDISLGSAPELGEVLRIVFDRDLGLTSQTAHKQGSAASYLFGSKRVGPEASNVPELGPFVVWTGRMTGATPSDGLFFQLGDNVVQVDDPGDAFIPVTDPVAALRPAYTESAPAAVWMTDVPGGGVDLFAGTAAGESSQLSQCQDDPSFTGYGLHAGLTLEDLWTVSWSKQGDTFASENAVVQCAGSTCEDRSGIAPGAECSDAVYNERVNDNFRHLLVEAFDDPDDADFIYQVIVVAAEAPPDGADAQASTTMALVVNSVDVSPNDSPLRKVGTLTFATGEGTLAPDWPEVAVLPPDKIAVSWTQRSEDGTEDEAHFVRYRICD